MGSRRLATNKPFDFPPWPVRPRPIGGEAVVGYLMRVAQANGYESLRPLRAGVGGIEALYEGVRLTLPERKTLFGPHPSYWGRNDFEMGLVSADFNHQLMRWCPLCFLESAHLRGQWMLKLCCVCNRHGTNLHDRCPVCGLVQRLERVDFERCECGARLAAASAVSAAAPLVRVTQAIEASIFGNATPGTLPSLAVAEWLRMASYLGQFTETFQPARPGKVANLHQLERASSLISGLGQLLNDWPKNFHAILAAIHRNAEATPSIRRAFGPIYRVLYAELMGDSFQFLRDEFESFLHDHWWGVVCKRNRSFRVETVAAHPRVTLKQAAHQAGVTPAIVRHFVQAELIHGDQATLPSGRKIRSVHRDDLAQIQALANDALTISEAARLLALPERRLRELILSEIITPLVSRPRVKAAGWLIPRQQVQALFVAGNELNDESPLISVRRIAKFWRLFDGEFVALVRAISSNHLPPVAVQPGTVPLGEVLLDVQGTRKWLLGGRLAAGSNMSIDQAAQQLGLKQQVVYDLNRPGF